MQVLQNIYFLLILFIKVLLLIHPNTIGKKDNLGKGHRSGVIKPQNSPECTVIIVNFINFLKGLTQEP